MHPSLAHWDQPPAASSRALQSKDRPEQQKKPRHRHSASQLAALNELYEKNEHPSLEDRTALAQRLGMETKTVNSWFQNKRASSKKRHKAPLTQCELPPISALIASVSAPPAPHPQHQLEYDDYSEDEYHHPLSHQPQHQLPPGAHPPQQHTLFYAGNPQHKHLFEAEGSMPRKARSRPTAAQTEELKKLYEQKPHPTKEEREALGDKIGMRYQSVTNWFQNQRSIAKKREEAAAAKAAALDSASRAYTPSLLPPASGAAHPSLSVPPATSHPSLSALLQPPRARRSPSAAPSSASRPSSPRASPYHTPADRAYDATNRRPRRTRPEPYQLEALKKLFKRTRTPSIEDRQMLAAEVGMDVNKVTNWFRNLRQSNRKRARQNGSASADEGDGDEYGDSMDMDDDRMTQSSLSRTATPGVASASGVEYVKIETEERLHCLHHPRGPYARSALAQSHSDMGSDEDTLQEAVTPSPESSPPPSTVASTSSLALPLPHPHAREAKASLERYPLEYAQYERERMIPSALPAMETGVKMEDALLLLSFHHSTVVH
ncbi:hypothetical protein BD413DRAFT_601471 [Trametes elegans]|nr:hypothetical protein BD413DRAFT_601471 [Trametes elegans]